MRRAFIAAVALGFAVAACGDDGEADAQPYIDAVSADLQDPDDDDSPGLDEETAECLATALVDVVGADRLEEDDIDPDDLADAESLDDLDITLDDDAQEQLADGIVDCDVETAIVEAAIDEIGADVPSGTTECLSDAIDDDAFSELMVASVVDGSDVGADTLLRAFADCPDALAELVAAGIEAELGAQLSSDAIECIASHIEDDPDAAADAMNDGDVDAYGAALLEACPEIVSG